MVYRVILIIIVLMVIMVFMFFVDFIVNMVMESSSAVENEKNTSTFQKSDLWDPENYRSIANLNHFGKIYEKLILKRVWSDSDSLKN
jgi:ABC-type phosphate transport system permease subunit